LLEFCSRDATTVRMIYIYIYMEKAGRNLLLHQPTFHMTEEPPPTKEVRNVIDHCHSRKNSHIYDK
jgi:hypothetical protein